MSYADAMIYDTEPYNSQPTKSCPDYTLRIF